MWRGPLTVHGWLAAHLVMMAGCAMAPCDQYQPDAAGIIQHPTYGTYPAVVPFEQGMDLLPCQEARMDVFLTRSAHEPEGGLVMESIWGFVLSIGVVCVSCALFNLFLK